MSGFALAPEDRGELIRLTTAGWNTTAKQEVASSGCKSPAEPLCAGHGTHEGFWDSVSLSLVAWGEELGLVFCLWLPSPSP